MQIEERHEPICQRWLVIVKLHSEGHSAWESKSGDNIAESITKLALDAYGCK